MLDQPDLNRKAVRRAIQLVAESWKHPASSVEDVLTQVNRNGLMETVSNLRDEQT